MPLVAPVPEELSERDSAVAPRSKNEIENRECHGHYSGLRAPPRLDEVLEHGSPDGQANDDNSFFVLIQTMH